MYMGVYPDPKGPCAPSDSTLEFLTINRTTLVVETRSDT